MNNNLDKLIERAEEKHSMPLKDFIKSENLETYELGYVDILYADELNIAKIPHEEYMILLREREEGGPDRPNVVEYAIYSQEDHDGITIYNSLNMNATYHLVNVCTDTFRNMASAIAEATEEIYNIDEQITYIVSDITDDCQEEDLTIDDAKELIKKAQELGYEYSDMLTPKMFLEIYNDLKPEEE